VSLKPGGNLSVMNRHAFWMRRSSGSLSPTGRIREGLMAESHQMPSSNADRWTRRTAIRQAGGPAWWRTTSASGAFQVPTVEAEKDDHRQEGDALVPSRYGWLGS